MEAAGGSSLEILYDLTERRKRGHFYLVKNRTFLFGVDTESLDPGKLRSTRAFLPRERYSRNQSRRSAKLKPEIVRYNGLDYIVDGHNKAKKAHQLGKPIRCRVLSTKHQRIGMKLERMDAGPLEEIKLKP